ncbi:hypothetical protein SETIT_6G009700v2 [Setaria italica]|uniref:At1g61320/AtMIF1 LRR domain-containing protein n=1 Tax=Setaria italica TaxID=4555 RepID=K3YH15_SETIT|nr:uncharacterized protein LOC101766405 [Setaria italica]RCV29391.1 hypothetical protein SETIT_6G009700v2 [Setaria italica]
MISGGRKVSSSTGTMETPALQSEQERPRQTTASNGSTAPVVDGIQGTTPSPSRRVDGGDSKDGETSGCSIPDLPMDIWRHIHSLMPMDAAARAACLSHAFLSSWRCYPKLTLNMHALCYKPRAFGNYFFPTYDGGNLTCRIDSILRNHSGIGLKILRLDLYGQFRSFPYIDSWLQVAVTPGIEELTLRLHEKYKLPCSILSDGVRNSIRSLQLDCCVFRPTPEPGPLRNLTKLSLMRVRITGDELECLLSNSLALEHLDLTGCDEIIILKVPSVLQQLCQVTVIVCRNLRVIENKAPSISSFTLTGEVSTLSLGEASQKMKVLGLDHANAVHYARAKLPAIMPNLERLYLCCNEVDTPMLPTKFLNLKHLYIQTIAPTFSPYLDYFSLASFLDACPSLESWNLEVSHQEVMEHESIFGGSSHLRQLPECRHHHLKSVGIIGFSSAKSLVELTCYIVKSAVSLERLTLDTLPFVSRCSGANKHEDCTSISISKSLFEEVPRGVAAIRKYIEDKVPPTAELTVLELCPRCHTTIVDEDRG